MTKLFLDDERFPVDNSIIVRSSNEAIQYVMLNGVPDFISFDHDLGGDDTSMVFIHWLIEEYLNGNILFPDNFSYDIHSQNPIGTANIRGLLDNFIKNM